MIVVASSVTSRQRRRKRVSKKRGNGEGSIARRKDGRWWGRYYVYTPEGRKQKAVYGKTRAEVAVKLRRVMADVDGGVFFDAGTVTVGEFLDRWLADCVGPLVDQARWSKAPTPATGDRRNHLKPMLGRRKVKSWAAPRCAGCTS
jgi:integrase